MIFDKSKLIKNIKKINSIEGFKSFNITIYCNNNTLSKPIRIYAFDYIVYNENYNIIEFYRSTILVRRIFLKTEWFNLFTDKGLKPEAFAILKTSNIDCKRYVLDINFNLIELETFNENNLKNSINQLNAMDINKIIIPTKPTKYSNISYTTTFYVPINIEYNDKCKMIFIIGYNESLEIYIENFSNITVETTDNDRYIFWRNYILVKE